MLQSVLDVGRYQGHYFLKLALLKLAALQHPVPRMQFFVPCLIAVHYRGLLHMVVGLLRNGGQCGADDSLALAYHIAQRQHHTKKHQHGGDLGGGTIGLAAEDRLDVGEDAKHCARSD